jgi:hypothetical protein
VHEEESSRKEKRKKEKNKKMGKIVTWKFSEKIKGNL